MLVGVMGKEPSEWWVREGSSLCANGDSVQPLSRQCRMDYCSALERYSASLMNASVTACI